jgi:hypothetical protein
MDWVSDNANLSTVVATDAKNAWKDTTPYKPYLENHPINVWQNGKSAYAFDRTSTAR